MTRILLILAVVALYVLHQDFWNWSSVGPLAFGFLPVGLWYHALYTIAVAILMCLLVKFAWPAHLERQADSTEADSAEDRR